MELLNEKYEIVQLSYSQQLLLVSTLYRSIVCCHREDRWKVSQVGQKERKVWVFLNILSVPCKIINFELNQLKYLTQNVNFCYFPMYMHAIWCLILLFLMIFAICLMRGWQCPLQFHNFNKFSKAQPPTHIISHNNHFYQQIMWLIIITIFIKNFKIVNYIPLGGKGCNVPELLQLPWLLMGHSNLIYFTNGNFRVFSLVLVSE